MKENEFQAKVIQEIRNMLPDSIVLKNDECYRPGFPDLTVLNGGHWAVLEMKKEKKASHRPNQDYYIDKCRKMGGYAAFVYPENKDEVLHELQQALQP